jgi:hypothetical protein
MKKFLIVTVFTVFFGACKVQTNFNYKGIDDISGVYKVFMGKIDSLEVYIVDGQLVRREIFSDFIFGGNEQRYPFIPHNEIWIDDAVSAKEYATTLQHEVLEMNLMRDFQMTYIQAHDSSLMLEVKLRNDFYNESNAHEKSLPKVTPTDTDSIKQIPTLPEKIQLNNIYLQKKEIINNKHTVWLVDGDKIRREIYPDFGFDGNRYDYNFIPENEIWIDGNISCSEYIYSFETGKNSVELLTAGEDYESMTKKVRNIVDEIRIKMFNQLAKKIVTIDKNNLSREKGIKYGIK